MALKAKISSRTNEAKVEALKEVSREKTMRFNANVPERLYLKVKIKAAQENVKLNDLAIKWMEDWVSK